jgi:CBS domain containing-hemolysin-like protein
MTAAYWAMAGAFVASALTLLFSTLTYALRDFSRTRLTEALERRNQVDRADQLVEHSNDLIFTTAVGRLFSNLLLLIFILELAHNPTWPKWAHYLLAVLATGLIAMFCSVAIPHALSRHAGEAILAGHARFLLFWRSLLSPVTVLMNLTDRLVKNLAGDRSSDVAEEKVQELEQEILSVVEEGEKEGVVDETEREMITSVIEFRETTVGQIMTARTEIFALPIDASLSQVKRALEESGHSRLPVFDGSLDKVVGVLYARDLLQFVGLITDRFDIRAAMRQPLYVPKTKTLRDLLSDFRIQKIHIAIVLDEYGGTAGLVTIEDVVEELVGDISDEHEPHEPALLKRLSDTAAEVDARMYIDELNRIMGLNLPEDAGYDTLGGFLSTTIGRIPAMGTVFEHGAVRYTILDAEPQKVNRVKLEVIATPEAAPTSL